MNCVDFEGVVGDLASGHLMDVEQREKALGHATSCACCGPRLADERALTDGLRFVAKAANQEAPARVEAALLAAFRRQQATVPATAPALPAKRQWLYAAAAAIIIVVALLALVASRTQRSQQPVEEKAVKAVPGSSEDTAPAITLPRPQQESAVAFPGPRRKPADRVRLASRSNHPAGNLNKPETTAEIATDFIPLMNREAFGQMDGGQVMRVELPRSALMSFGLPMDMERATERIKADVVVGNDGLARAIRFVR